MFAGTPFADKHQLIFFGGIHFLIIAFGLVWGILALYIFFPDSMILVTAVGRVGVCGFWGAGQGITMPNGIMY